MNERCLPIRESLVAWAQGELDGLEAERVRAHLAHCAACTAIADDLASGIQAARVVPTVSDEELAALLKRAAIVAPARTPVPLLVVPTAAVVLATLVLAIVGPQLYAQARERAALRKAIVVTERSAPSPHVKLLTSAPLDGAVHQVADATTIDLRRGFVVIAFRGAAASVSVNAPALAVRALPGARFSVDVSGGVTTVHVGAGGVVLTSATGSVALAEGEHGVFDAKGRRLHPRPPQAPARAGVARELLDDPELVRFVGPPASG